jgi:hypothetical protein
VTRHADGRYDHTKPWVPGVEPAPIKPRYSYLGPWASNEERLTQQAMQTNTMPSADLADLVRCPLPQVDLFPPRFGYPTEVPGIMDVVQVDRYNNNPRVSWFSGGVAGYSGTLRNVEGS